MLRIQGEGSLDVLQAIELSSHYLRGLGQTPGANSPKHSDALCTGLCRIWEQCMRDRGARLRAQPIGTGKSQVTLRPSPHDLSHVQGSVSSPVKGGGGSSSGRSGNSEPGGFIGQHEEIRLAAIPEGERSHRALTRSVLHGPPLNSHFRNGSNEGAVPVTFTDEVYDLVSDFLDGVPIIPYVFSRLEETKNKKAQSAGLGNNSTVAFLSST